MSEQARTPPRLSDFAANEAVSFLGELFPDCQDCCSEQTDGDLCERCKRAHLIVGRAMDYAMTSALESVAKEACDLCARPEPFGVAVKATMGRKNWRHVVSDGTAYACICPWVHDALSRLRSGAGAGEEK